MCRFANASDPNYIKVSAEIRYITDISYNALFPSHPGEEVRFAADLAAINASVGLSKRVRGMRIWTVPRT